jgi:hypothetical protein
LSGTLTGNPTRVETVRAIRQERRNSSFGDPVPPIPKRNVGWLILLWSAVLAAIVVGPMMRSGWVLLLDWVTGPRMNIADRFLAGDSLPAGPTFFGFAHILHWLFGAAVGWILPWSILAAAGFGAAMLVTNANLATAVDRPDTQGRGVVLVRGCTAATAFLWNPFVHERLYSGQLAVLTGYAFLPYLMSQCLRSFRNDGSWVNKSVRIAGPALVWALSAAASIHYAVIGGVIVGVVAIAEWITGHKVPTRWFVSVLALMAVVTALWLVPLFSDAPPTGDQQTIAAFATRPDPSIGLAGGVALQTGFWRPSLGEPNSNLGWWWPLAGGVLGAAALVGLVSLYRSNSKRLALAAGGLALIGWLLGQGSNGLIGPLFRVLTDIPTFRVMREAGKFVALLSLAWSIGLAGFAAYFANGLGRNRKNRSTFPLLFLVATLPIALTPGLAWGVGGRLRAVHYPSDWTTIANELQRHPKGKVILLPFVGYFDPGFTNTRTVRNPGRAFFGPRVILSDDAQIPGLGPSRETTAIALALLSKSAGNLLAKQGIGWVVGPPNSFAGNPDFEPVTGGSSWVLFLVTRSKTEPR